MVLMERFPFSLRHLYPSATPALWLLSPARGGLHTSLLLVYHAQRILQNCTISLYAALFWSRRYLMLSSCLHVCSSVQMALKPCPRKKSCLLCFKFRVVGQGFSYPACYHDQGQQLTSGASCHGSEHNAKSSSSVICNTPFAILSIFTPPINDKYQ